MINDEKAFNSTNIYNISFNDKKSLKTHCLAATEKKSATNNLQSENSFYLSQKF